MSEVPCNLQLQLLIASMHCVRSWVINYNASASHFSQFHWDFCHLANLLRCEGGTTTTTRRQWITVFWQWSLLNRKPFTLTCIYIIIYMLYYLYIIHILNCKIYIYQIISRYRNSKRISRTLAVFSCIKLENTAIPLGRVYTIIYSYIYIYIIIL